MRWSVAIAATITAIACPETEPTARVVAGPTTPASGCGDCHAAETAEWNSSLHHSAFTDRDFQASFEVESQKFCSDCHAADGEANGIGCPSCHASKSGHGAAKSNCANCHEFAFPHRQDLMQSTIREHAESDFRETSCTGCHMPRASDGHRDHRFGVSRSSEFMKRAFAMKTTRTAEGVAIDVTPKNVGHKFPTGDLFRRVRIVVRSETADGTTLGEDEIGIGRRFDRAREIADTRLAGPRRFTLTGEWLTKAARITVEARYERVAQTTELRDARGGRQRHDSVFGHIILAEAVLE